MYKRRQSRPSVPCLASPPSEALAFKGLCGCMYWLTTIQILFSRQNIPTGVILSRAYRTHTRDKLVAVWELHDPIRHWIDWTQLQHP